MGITIIGLGPGDPYLMTCEARELLEKAEEVYLRTKHHPAVDSLPHHLQLHSFDHLYEEVETFEEIYERIAQEILRLGERPEGILYAVPGHPLVGEASVHRILALAQERGVLVRIVVGMSFLEPVFSLLKVDPLSGLQIGDAVTLASRSHPGLNPDTPALIGQLYSRTVASGLKLTLMNLYPDDHLVILLQGAGTRKVKIRTLPLHELDHEKGIDHLTSLFIPPLSAPSSFSTLQDIVARLRAPDGCPWDREQTPQSLRPFLLEETYEALEALDLEDTERLREELGDLLLEVLLQVQIAAEGGEFKMPDVLRGIITKLIRRHPHVFGDSEITTSGEVVSQWQEIKREEGQLAEGPFADLPLTMPALARAQRIEQVAPARGLTAARDEAELLARVKKGLEEVSKLAGEEAEEAWGRLLFDLVALANLKGIDAESALRKAVRELERRLGSPQT
ncbi:MAG: MazG family protein [Anaerolineae bacterium]